MTQHRKHRNANQLRIIGGKWRGRKLNFPDVPDLRPTGDRIRETLFNWLQGDIPGSQCLDLFAGSGALGWEALSRGAKQVVFLDSHSKVIRQLKESSKLLACDQAQFIQADAREYLNNQQSTPFDVVFLDPPFKQEILQKLVNLLYEKQWLASHAKIYLEMDVNTTTPVLPDSWHLLKEKKAGLVRYQLWTVD